jgi:hypothetical protein
MFRPVLNVGMAFSPTETAPPVRGLRAVYDSRSLTTNTPKSRSSTRSPRTRAAVMVSRIVLTIFHVPLVQVRVPLSDPLNQFRLEHSWLWSRDLGVLLSGRSRICCESPRSEQHRAKKEAPRRALVEEMAGQWGLKRTGSPPMLKLEESSSHPRAPYGLCVNAESRTWPRALAGPPLMAL